MPCNCGNQFTIFKRKRTCVSCHCFYCANCLGKKKKNFCFRCEIIFVSSKRELMELKTKDLIFFLQSRKINITGIVEKEELCNLIINHINSSSYYDTNINSPSSSTTTNRDFENFTPNFDQIKQSCQNIFSSLTDKITSDFQKTTCFNPTTISTQNQQKDNVTTQQPRSSSRFNIEQNPGTSYANAAPHFQSSVSYESQKFNKPILKKSSPNCDCSDEEIDEICERNQSIINGESKSDNYHKMKKTKLSNSSSNNSSSFEEVLAAVNGKQQSDDDWQFVESQNFTNKPSNYHGESSSSSQREREISSQTVNESELIKSCALAPNILSDDISNLRRRCSDSSLLNIKKNNMNIDILSFNENKNEVSKIKVSCKKCGKAKSKLKNEIIKLSEQLKAANKSEDEINARIKKFMDYLESKNQVSEMTETDSSEILFNADNDNERNTSLSNEEIQENILDENDGINVYASNTESEIPSHQQPSCSSVENTKRFISLGDISSSADLELMTVKQLKEILMLNRVDYKGCCEKKELKERVQRLWESHISTPPSDRLSSIDLCKICMDAPIECVFLECGHSLGCISCCKILNECPICRSYIVRVVRIFKS